VKPAMAISRVTIPILALCLLYPVAGIAADKGLSRQVLAEINLARKNPAEYAGFLRKFRERFQGDCYRQTGRRPMVRTTEGVGAVDEAIRFLSRQKPLPPLAWSPGLAAAAADLVVDEGTNGATGHQGRESGGPEERIERHCKPPAALGEVIFYGPGDARQVVMNLIIDDGVSGRGHRKNIFSPAFSTAGAAYGPHPGYEAICVVDFAGGQVYSRRRM